MAQAAEKTEHLRSLAVKFREKHIQVVFYLNAIQLDEDLGPAHLSAYYEDLLHVDEHLFRMYDILEAVKKDCKAEDEINCINAMSTMIDHLSAKQMLCYSILDHANVVGNIAILGIVSSLRRSLRKLPQAASAPMTPSPL